MTPVTEVTMIEHASPTVWWKLVTLAGQSFYYDKNQIRINATFPCLEARQPDPPQPGRTDPIVNDGCPVCNDTFPCLFDILNDPYETSNLASNHPDVVQRLYLMLQKYQASYVTGRLTEIEIEESYVKYENVSEHWDNYLGPCYYVKEEEELKAGK